MKCGVRAVPGDRDMMIRGGGDGGEDMPVPMPNTEAKLPRGDNSPSGEGSALPLFFVYKPFS